MRYEPLYSIPALDIEDWRWMIERYAGTVDDVCELRGIKRRTVYEHIARWVRHGYFYRKSGFLLPRQPAYWECGVPFTFHDLGIQFLRHAEDVKKVERWLRNRSDMIVMSWITERWLRHWRGLHDSYDIYKSADHVPDAEAEILSRKTGAIEKVAIEVERTYKGPGRTYEILGKLAANYNHIWYFAELERVYNPLKTCIANMPPDDIEKFHLWKLDTITCEPKLTPTRTQVSG